MKRWLITAAACSLTGCFGLFGSGNIRKVNIYPDDSTWTRLSSGATKLGWTATPHASMGVDLRISPSDGKAMDLWANEDICALGNEHGCRGLGYRCDDGLDAKACTQQFMKLAEASGFNPSELKVSNNGQVTESGTPYAP